MSDVIIEAWRPVPGRPTLRGYCRCRFDSGIAGGVIMDEIAIHYSADDGNTWCYPPARPMIGRDGNLVRDTSGKLRYVSIIEFPSARIRRDWCDGIIAALLRKYPNALLAAVESVP
jgi:hypothetical protein